MFQAVVSSAIFIPPSPWLARRNVLFLRRFISTYQQHRYGVAAPRAIDAIARAEIQLQFEHATAQLAMIAGIALLHWEDSRGDPRLRLRVAQRVEPFPEPRGLPDFDHL